MSRAYEVVLTIPDNEARTALATLRKLGIGAGNLERADVWRFEVKSAYENGLLEALSRLETVFNPNKHRLRERSSPAPELGEVWIDEISPAGASAPSAAARLAGVVRSERFTGWRVYDRLGNPAGAEVVDAAVETLLCNRAFQRAIR